MIGSPARGAVRAVRVGLPRNGVDDAGDNGTPDGWWTAAAGRRPDRLRVAGRAGCRHGNRAALSLARPGRAARGRAGVAALVVRRRCRDGRLRRGAARRRAPRRNARCDGLCCGTGDAMGGAALGMATPAMWLAHSAAVLGTAWLLARGEAWLWRMADRVVRAATAKPTGRPVRRHTVRPSGRQDLRPADCASITGRSTGSACSREGASRRVVSIDGHTARHPGTHRASLSSSRIEHRYPTPPPPRPARTRAPARYGHRSTPPS